MKRHAAKLLLLAALAVPTAGADSCNTSTGGSSTDTGIDHGGTNASTTPAQPKRPAKPRHFSGNGSTNLGTIKAPTDSEITWTYTSDVPGTGLFVVQDADYNININTSGKRGKSALPAGTYKNVQVTASGDWTLTIKPRG